MRSDPRNDRCAPFAKNRLVSGERTNRSYRVVPPRYPGTLFAASLLSLSSLSFENTRSTHTHTRCTVPDHPSTWLLFSNVTKGVVLRAILLLLFLYTARYILRSRVPGVSYLAKWLLVDALGPDSPLYLTSAFSPFPSWWLAAPVARRLSSVHVLRFVPSWHASVNLTASILGSRFAFTFTRLVYVVFPMDSLWSDRRVGSDAPREDRSPWENLGTSGSGYRPRSGLSIVVLTGQPLAENSAGNCTPLYDLHATCCLKIRVILVGELCVGRERRIYPRYSDPTNVVRELLSRVSFDSPLGWQVDRIYLAGLRTGIWRGWSSSRS